MRNPALFARIFNTPLMVHSAKLDAIIAGIGNRFGIDEPVNKEAALLSTGEKRAAGYEVVGGVAVIDVFGVLAHRGRFEADSSYVLGYDIIGTRLQNAMNDEQVKSVLLQMDSPGGEVNGCFELAAQIKEFDAIKPIYSAISSLSASANYLLACATREISITATGVAGSIGVVMRHADISKMVKKQGVSVTHIFAGAHKVDGNQFEPLSADVRANFQAEVDTLYSLFVDTVSQYRGLDASIVRSQEAGVFSGQDAINAGLADRIATPDQMLTEMQRNYSNQTIGKAMNLTELKAEHASVYQAAFNEGAESIDAAASNTQGADTERERISAILGHEEAKGREAQAQVLALESAMSAEVAGKLLAASPKTAPAAAAAAKGGQLDAHMTALGNPDVGADGDGDMSEKDETQAAMALILGDK